MFSALTRCFCLGFVSALWLASFSAGAEELDTSGFTPLEVPLPPTDIRPFDENLDEPQVTIRKEEGGTVEEYRLGGKLYMMKIIPNVGKPYFLIDKSGDGQFERMHERDTGISVPMWVIGTF